MASRMEVEEKKSVVTDQSALKNDVIVADLRKGSRKRKSSTKHLLEKNMALPQKYNHKQSKEVQAKRRKTGGIRPEYRYKERVRVTQDGMFVLDVSDIRNDGRLKSRTGSTIKHFVLNPLNDENNLFGDDRLVYVTMDDFILIIPNQYIDDDGIINITDPKDRQEVGKKNRIIKSHYNFALGGDKFDDKFAYIPQLSSSEEKKLSLQIEALSTVKRAQLKKACKEKKSEPSDDSFKSVVSKKRSIPKNKAKTIKPASHSHSESSSSSNESKLESSMANSAQQDNAGAQSSTPMSEEVVQPQESPNSSHSNSATSEFKLVVPTARYANGESKPTSFSNTNGGRHFVRYSPRFFNSNNIFNQPAAMPVMLQPVPLSQPVTMPGMFQPLFLSPPVVMPMIQPVPQLTNVQIYNPLINVQPYNPFLSMLPPSSRLSQADFRSDMDTSSSELHPRKN